MKRVGSAFEGDFDWVFVSVTRHKSTLKEDRSGSYPTYTNKTLLTLFDMTRADPQLSKLLVIRFCRTKTAAVEIRS